ncbi:WD40 repeat domain-containing protein [Streptomyces thermolilacinus]|uniref:WD40 repeat domain-containing protein n=1 Tax=Streptomyces thermolilacinus TaxID=285540 RepID=UPI0033F76BA7
MRATVWTVANALGVVAGTPGELLTALLSAPRRPDRVVLPAGTPGVGELAADLRALGHVEVAFEEPERPVPPPGRPRLSDPAAVCAADPVRVTRLYEEETGPYGGLRAAWLRAGQALVRDGQTPPGRALALLAALPEGAKEPVRDRLAALAADAPWTVAGVREGRVTALTVCGGRPVETDDRRTRAVACLGDGTRLTLDERGRLRTSSGPAPRLVEAVAATLAAHPATALAAVGDTVLTGDRMGFAHAFSLAGLHQAALHSGRVTALTATGGPRVYSGGADGTVRLWRPGGEADDAPVVARRPHPVAALHAWGAALAVAWADGLVELRDPAGGGVPRPFRPGPAVRALALLPDGTLAVGTDETCVLLRARPA